ncbi:hypothetical protein B0A48_17237 [Cryoendolithus antarcticus]|uniref:Uncharacterized protein n=1 Tax=Cryoendolithus antarcticus TaxID=1507870 RepID=A0A1V8SDX0_9PEZI|nr:hypothetical protein B0A48_17237 [Cryoendolithus antarcticus]
MGLKSYFKPAVDDQKAAAEEHAEPDVLPEKVVENAASPHRSLFGLPPDSPGFGSPWTSRPSSPTNAEQTDMADLKCQVTVNYLHQQQVEKTWVQNGYDEGVVVKKGRGSYACCPLGLAENPDGFLRAVELLNVKSAVTINTRVIQLFLEHLKTPFVPLKGGLSVQVLEEMAHLPQCLKHTSAAFISDRRILVVWDDNPRHLLTRAQDMEKQLMDMIWDAQSIHSDEDQIPKEPHVKEKRVFEDDETAVKQKPRRFMLITPMTCALSLCLCVASIGTGWKQLVFQSIVDNNWIRLVFVALFAPQFWLAIFFFQCLVGDFFQVVAPIKQMLQNSKFYSGVRSPRIRREPGSLPHITIQMPVYREGIANVIAPTIRSLKAAISTYEMQGGSANIFVNEDGMQLDSDTDAQVKQDFYEEHNIGWVARPAHKQALDDGSSYIRRGKFKKASNMNYCLWVSSRVEDKLANVERHDGWAKDDEDFVYRNALAEVVEEDQGRTWADGNIRIGDYILIIDSDTRVPTDCFLDAVSEMEQCPEVAIIQYASGVMQVSDSFFERGITFFTDMVYTQIRYAVSNGDVAPFVGHNAVIRWSAQQQIAYHCKLDNHEKIWSEETVSEDFDMALRLQSIGYIVRLGAYFDGGFKEGVSLTVQDELARWEKYAFGCSELLFHPIRHWYKRGLVTKLFRTFLFSCMPLPAKFNILAYIGTYYAIGCSFWLTLANYFLVGWFNGFLDHYYVDSFKLYFAIVIVFTGCGNLALAYLRYRINEMGFLASLWENISWIPMMTIFLGGISIHVSQALVSHLVGKDMSWGATQKEIEDTTFGEEFKRILKGFKWTLAICFIITAGMIVLAFFVPPLWRIRQFTAIWPLGTLVVSHVALPIALNPGLMRFKF